MRVLLVGKNSRHSFSGGRLYAWHVATALQQAGHEVVYLTNCRPGFAEEAEAASPRGVDFRVGNMLTTRLPSGSFDAVIAVPHLRSRRLVSDDRLYEWRASRRATRDAALLVLLSFETPNWIAALAGESRPPRAYDSWERYANRAHVVLSISGEGNRYAREHFSARTRQLRFAYCYPPIESDVCDQVPAQADERRIIAITRFADAHKSGGVLARLIDERMKNATLEIICGAGGVPEEDRAALDAACALHGVKLEVRERVTSSQKFASLKRARVLVYPSRFEGFGLPPIEAQYCGTPVVAYDLPVLREVTGQSPGMRLVPVDDVIGMRSAVAELLDAPPDRARIRQGVEGVAKFAGFVTRISSLLTVEHRRFRNGLRGNDNASFGEEE